MGGVEILGVVLVVVGAVCGLLGVVGSFLPGVPGPPISAIAPALVQGGAWAVTGHPGTVEWVVVGVCLVLGALATVADLAAPLLSKYLGKTNRSAVIGGYFGLFIALGLGAQIGGCSGVSGPVTMGLSVVFGVGAALVLMVLGPFAGAFVGQLAGSEDADVEMVDLMRRAALSGLAQCVSLLLTTGVKVAYGVVVLGVGVVLAVVAFAV